MIGYLEGKLLEKRKANQLLLLVNYVGYEVLVPKIVMRTIRDKSIGDSISLYIYYYQTERQPKPVLIGFNLEKEKNFFQNFISVDSIGPLKAVQALNIPISDIANAIEKGDIDTLKNLNGIGSRTAHKILASLRGKMDKFASNYCSEFIKFDIDSAKTVVDVLVLQLGYKSSDAKRIVKDVLENDRSINTAEELFDKIYKSKSTY